MMLQLLPNHRMFAQPPITWAANLSIDDTNPVPNCTCINLTFELTQAWLDDEPMTDITLDLYLLSGKYEMCGNPGFVLQSGQIPVSGLGAGNGLADVWRMTGVSIPSIDDGGMLTILVSVRVVGSINDPEQSIAFSARYESNVIGPETEGPVIPDYTVIMVGAPSTTTSLQEVATGELDHLAQPPGGTGQDVLIEGTLLVDVSYDFANNSNLHIAPGAIIKVQNGATFRLLDLTHVRGCQNTWQGIEILAGGSFVADGSTDQYPSEMVVIEDAENAVIARDGSSVSAKQTIFRNNGKGIFVSKNSNLSYAAIWVEQCWFETTSFSFLGGVAGVYVNDLVSTVSLKENTFFDFYYGVYASNCVSIVSRNNRFTNMQTGNFCSGVALLDNLGNFFQNMQFGIKSENSNLVVRGDKFMDIGETGIYASSSSGAHYLTQAGLGLNENNPTFSSCKTGIATFNMEVLAEQNVMKEMKTGFLLNNYGGKKNAVVRNNIVRAGNLGIGIQGWKVLSSLEVSGNDIHIEGEVPYATGILGAGIRGNNSLASKFYDNHLYLTDTRYGIHLWDCQLLGLRQNSVELLNEGLNLYDGIQLDGCNYNLLFCNSIEGDNTDSYHDGITFSLSPINTARCNSTDNIRTGLLVLGANNPLTLRGNDFYDHFNAWQVGWPQVGGGITGKQVHAGNRWLQSYAGVGAAHYGDPNEVSFSKLIYNPSDDPEYSSTDYPFGELFDKDPSGNAYQCGSEPAGCPPLTAAYPDEISETDRAVATDSIGFSVYTDAQNWSAKRHLYRRLLRDSGLVIPASVMDTFLTVHSTTTVGIFEQLRKDIEDLFDAGEQSEDQLAAQGPWLTSKVQELQTLDSLFTISQDQQVRDSLQTLRQGVIDEIAAATEDYAAFRQSLDTVRREAAAQLLSVNNAVSVTAGYEQNQKAYNRIFLEQIAYGQDTLSQEQRTALDSVASQCPYAGGDAVHQARALLNDGTVYDDQELCQPASPLKKPARTAGSPAFTIHPNPGHLFVRVELEEASPEVGNVILSNTLGRQVLSQTFSKGDNTVWLLLDEIPGGTYFLTVKAGNTYQSKIYIHLK